MEPGDEVIKTPIFEHPTVMIRDSELRRLISISAQRKIALIEVLKAIEAIITIMGPFDLEKMSKTEMVFKLPGIIEAFKKEKHLFTNVMNNDFYENIKKLTTDEFSG